MAAAPGLRLPSFLGIGTQKGGTTTLHQLLAQHPDVFLPQAKELHYFSLHHHRGPAWYGSHYAEAPLQARCGEITPYYLFHPLAPQRIRALLPEVRLLVLLRDPLERALSQYFHACRLGFESLALEEALAAEVQRLADAGPVLASGARHFSHQEHSYLARSRYELQLQRYWELFPPEQLLLLRSEQVFAAPELCWQRILDFLQLPPAPLPTAATALRANAGQGEAAAVSPLLRAQLRQELAPTYAWLEDTFSAPVHHWPPSPSGSGGGAGNG